MKMIERDQSTAEPDGGEPASQGTNNANDGSTRGILGILIGKFPIYFGGARIGMQRYIDRASTNRTTSRGHQARDSRHVARKRNGFAIRDNGSREGSRV